MSMRTKVLKSLAVLSLLAMPTIALAHKGEDHGASTGEAASLKGTVEAFADGKLTVKGGDGKVIDVHVDDRTLYENAGAPGKSEDLKVGARVVVHGESMADGRLHAKKVRFGKKTSSK